MIIETILLTVLTLMIFFSIYQQHKKNVLYESMLKSMATDISWRDDMIRVLYSQMQNGDEFIINEIRKQDDTLFQQKIVRESEEPTFGIDNILIGSGGCPKDVAWDYKEGIFNIWIQKN